MRAALLLALTAMPALAGEIPGLRAQFPPHQARDHELVFSNDFLGRGGSTDDFRTQQIIVTSRLAENWLALIDHSILTLDDGTSSGRIDQLSASLGYDVVKRVSDDRIDSVALGFGLRSRGSFGGERMQNGFHRLIGSEIEDLPYVADDGTDATVWLDANHHTTLREAGEGVLMTGWRRGGWLRLGSLATSGGQWDNTVSIMALASRPSMDLWFGVRGDWRSGYESLVLRETAVAEDDISLVAGARFGPLVLETVQQLNNDASYGQLRLVSGDRRGTPSRDSVGRFGVDIGFSLPNVQMRVAGKHRVEIPALAGSPWQESVVLAASYGEPQFGSDNRVFARTRQLDVGLEFERPLAASGDALRLYVTTAAGWRAQSLIALTDGQDEQSDSVGRAVVVVGAGLRASTTDAAQGWRLSIQTGLLAHMPLADARLEFDDRSLRVQKATLDLLLGFALDFH